MSDIALRLGVLLAVGITTWLLIKAGHRFIETRRQQALTAAPPAVMIGTDDTLSPTGKTPVRILAFSSTNCHQCHQLQAPALQRVLSARGDAVTVVDIDATSEQALVQTYHVLTVPSTVILDASGKAQAVNYGFANTQRLLGQVDQVLAKTIA